MKTVLFFISGTIALLLSSCCSNLYYVNDPVIFGNVSKKGDYNVAAGINTGTLTSGLHLHGNAAVSNRIFLTGAFTNYSGKCESLETTDNGKSERIGVKYMGNSFLFGVGYYKPIYKKLFFEASGGAKFGLNKNIRREENFEYRHFKYFLQPGLAFNSNYFQAGLALRMGLLDYLPYSTGSDQRVPEIASEPLKFYVDPAIYLCGGGKYVKVGTQVSATFADNINIAYSIFGSLFGWSSSDALSLSFFVRVTIPTKRQSE